MYKVLLVVERWHIKSVLIFKYEHLLLKMNDDHLAWVIMNRLSSKNIFSNFSLEKWRQRKSQYNY